MSCDRYLNEECIPEINGTEECDMCNYKDVDTLEDIVERMNQIEIPLPRKVFITVDESSDSGMEGYFIQGE